MNRKQVIALMLAGTFAAPMSATFAQSDEKEPKKPEESQLTISQSDEKETRKPEESQLFVAEGDEKEPKQPELAA